MLLTDVRKPIDVKCVERRALGTTLKITSRQTILKELLYPATSAEKLSGLEML